MVNIYLSVNNTYQEVTANRGVYTNSDSFIIIPVIPAEVSIKRPQSLQEFETVSLKKLCFIAPADLQSISWSSFFPRRDYPYVRGQRLEAEQYADIIDRWIDKKLPIRLVITGLSDNSAENIFMSCAVADFNHKYSTDGDLYYDIEFKEYPLPSVTSEEDELTSKEYDELISLIGSNSEKINALETGYQTIDDIPEWGREAVEFLITKGYINGEGQITVDPETGETTVAPSDVLNITDQLLKGLVIGYRAGAFGS